MRLQTIMRISPAAWLALPLVLLAILYVRTYILRGATEPYAAGLSSQAVTTMGLIAPICAGLGAWEAGRLRRAGVWDMPMVRYRSVVVAWLIGPPVLVGIVAVMAGVEAVLLANGLIVPDHRPVAVAAAVITAHSLAGFAVGVWIPTSIAVPAAIVVSFLWQIMIRVVEPLWLHLLSGQALEACCGTDTDIASAAFWAPIFVAAGIAVGALVLILARSGRVAIIAGCLALSVGLGTGSVIAQGQPDGEAHVGRDEALLVCSDPANTPRVCVWPEHAWRLSGVTALATRATRAWDALGIDVPRSFSEAVFSKPSAGTLYLRFTDTATDDDIIGSMAYGMLPPWTECPGAYRAVYAIDYLQAWYAASAGMSDEALTARFADLAFAGKPDILEAVNKVRALPPDLQRRWVIQNDSALRACDREPLLDPDW